MYRYTEPIPLARTSEKGSEPDNHQTFNGDKVPSSSSSSSSSSYSPTIAAATTTTSIASAPIVDSTLDREVAPVIGLKLSKGSFQETRTANDERTTSRQALEGVQSSPVRVGAYSTYSPYDVRYLLLDSKRRWISGE